MFVDIACSSIACSRRTETMPYEIGEKCEGLHDGRWYLCTILSQEDDGYKVTFDGWSRQFNELLSAHCVRPRTTIDVRTRKRWRPSVNFNKLLPGDEVSISVEGIRKPAVIRVVDPFQELLTVECGNEELIASFRDVLPPPEQPSPDTVKRRKPAASQQAAPAATPPPPISASVSLQSAIAPQFATIVRRDGEKISCGDLVSLTPNSADVVFIVLELYQDESEVLLNAQKCQLSDGVAVRLVTNFRLTCPASAVDTLQDTKLSSQLKKAVLEVRQGAILRLSQSLQIHMANRACQLQVRRYDLAAKLRCEIHRGMSSRAARTFIIKMGPADLRHDLELLGLAVDNSFKVEKSKNRLDDLDSLLGEKWDVKVKDDNRYFYANFAEFSLDLPSRSLLVKIKFAESTCSFRQDSYRQDTAADCC